MRDVVILLVLVGVVAGFLLTRISGGNEVGFELANLEYATIDVHVGDVLVNASVANTYATRLQGLSGVRSLAPNEGMLFIFETDGLQSFWMKDMLISIDILWITYDGEIAHIVEDAHPDSYPNQFVPDAHARYVLEVQSGFVETHNITLNTEIKFEK